MAWIYNNAVRAKFEDLSDCTLAQIAEQLVDLESEKAELEQRVEELTAERDDLAQQVEEAA